jgi:hypothetical protein
MPLGSAGLSLSFNLASLDVMDPVGSAPCCLRCCFGMLVKQGVLGGYVGFGSVRQ